MIGLANITKTDHAPSDAETSIGRPILMALLGITTLPRSYGETWLRVGVH